MFAEACECLARVFQPPHPPGTVRLHSLCCLAYLEDSWAVLGVQEPDDHGQSQVSLITMHRTLMRCKEFCQSTVLWFALIFCWFSCWPSGDVHFKWSTETLSRLDPTWCSVCQSEHCLTPLEVTRHLIRQVPGAGSRQTGVQLVGEHLAGQENLGRFIS